MLLEIAIADAYGAGFEFLDVTENRLIKYVPHSSGLILPGCYTDDTQMTIAIMEYMLDNDEPVSEKIADYFVKCYKRDKRYGYAKRFQSFLNIINDGADFLSKIESSSARNGAAMRSVPIGFYLNIDKLMNFAKIQASITHNTLVGIESSQAVALASHYFLYSIGPKKDFRRFVQSKLTMNWSHAYNAYVKCDAFETVNAAFTILEECDTYRDILLKSVNLGGDTDSVASIALGLASCGLCFDPHLPNFLYDDLEDGKFGKKYLMKLDEEVNKNFVRFL